jgi:NADPH-dependent ferric siderophore reductase
MRKLRKLLLDELQIERERLVTRGYWQLGEANHPDHDYGDDA